MESSPGDLTGQVLDRRFRVEGRLGSGGMGTVWRVQHVESLQRLALKTLDVRYAADRAALERFLREARAAGALRTRHVTRIIDAQIGYVHEGTPLPFIVMELLEGCTLQEIFDRRGRVSAGELCWALGQLARALATAHQRGIVHRDLKPSNVFVARDEEGEPGEREPIVKLCDFGIAKLVGDARMLDSERAITTQTGALMGTPIYLAPEVLSGSSAVPATDQWSLGLIAFRGLGGWEYFGGARALPELVLAIARDPLAPPSKLAPHLSPRFDAWFLRACARDPGQRFPDVQAAVTALEEALGRPQAVPLLPDAAAPATSPAFDRAPPEPDASGPPEPTSRGQRRPLPRAVTATLIAACCAWAVMSLWWLHARGQKAIGALVTAKTVAATAPATPTPTTMPTPTTAPTPTPTPTIPVTPPPAEVPTAVAAGATRAEAPPPPVVTTTTRAPTGEATGDRKVRRPGHHGRSAATGTSSPELLPPSAAPSPAARPAARPAAPPPARDTRLAPGQPCERSAECASGLCVAETCR